MKKNAIPITAILLLISVGNYFTIISNGKVRAVEFISILAIGALLGALLTQLIFTFKTRKK
jgi:hypothetical protein